MASKTVKRRRSNWYIYLISFLVTFVLLSLLIAAMWDSFFPERTATVTNNQGLINYVPEEELNTTVLLMMSESKGGVPSVFMLVNYRPRDDAIVLVPLKPELYASADTQSGKLTDLYASGGAEMVISGLKNTLNVGCGYYIKFDRNSFVNFAALVGDTPVNIPYRLEDGSLVFEAGSSLLSSADLYNYITFPEFQEGEDYRLVVIGSAVSALINSNYRNITIEKFQSMFSKITNTADTDLNFKTYTVYQRAFLYTSEHSSSPATYYIPFGDVDSVGNFHIAENSKLTVLNRFGLD